MITLKEAKAGEARVKKLVKHIKPVDMSKVVLPERRELAKGIRVDQENKKN